MQYLFSHTAMDENTDEGDEGRQGPLPKSDVAWEGGHYESDANGNECNGDIETENCHEGGHGQEPAQVSMIGFLVA